MFRQLSIYSKEKKIMQNFDLVSFVYGIHTCKFQEKRILT